MPENRLAREPSPYLRQHARNPVDWYPWGPEAFARARAEDKPVFLSIGYSTCHWCHVMAHESFENPAIAALLNAHFIPVKVDREERPDVDAQYMTAVQGLTGSGGWPLTAVLTPDGRPFFGGTYFPPEDRMGRPGLPRVLEQLHRAWVDSRDQVEGSAETVAEFVRGQAAPRAGALGPEVLERAVEAARAEYDALEGGFGAAPKFPRPHLLSFLLRRWERSGDPGILAMVEHTLDAMAAGGIHDHLGGGFARYSTDRRWLVPHFEKMLYDQALLLRAYTEAWQATGRERHAAAARDIAAYVLRDLRDPGGAFRSAEDADSEGEEGRYYVWAPDEILEVLGKDEAALFSAAYGVTLRGNFEGGHSVLARTATDAELAGRFELEPGAVAARLAASREALLRARERRVRPGLDDKVLTDWNGLMISALAHAGRALDEPKWIRAAGEAAAFVLGTLHDEAGLLHRYRDGEAGIPGFLDDHAFLAQGLLDLYLAGDDPAHLAAALGIARTLVGRFQDPGPGGFFFTASGHEALLTRDKQVYDGAAPSGNSAAARVLLALGDLAGDPELTRAGERTLEAFGGAVAAMPLAHPELLSALDFALGPTVEAVIAARPGDPDGEAMLAVLRRRYLPRVVFARRGPDEDGLPALAAYTRDMAVPESGARAYLCRERACERPVASVSAFTEALDRMTAGGPAEAGPDPA